MKNKTCHTVRTVPKSNQKFVDRGKISDGIKRKGDFFWSVRDFSFEKDTIGHIFTGQYYGLHLHIYITTHFPGLA